MNLFRQNSPILGLLLDITVTIYVVKQSDHQLIKSDNELYQTVQSNHELIHTKQFTHKLIQTKQSNN